MNKAGIVDSMAADSTVNPTPASLKKDAHVTRGAFSTSQRKARTGRNPQTGKPIKIAPVIYQNLRTGIRIDLSSLKDGERSFYRAAKQRFDSGIAWFDFDDFAFGSNSPLYRGHASHHEVLQHPLYVVLKDMWLELGVRQGRVRAETRKVFPDASRRTQRESGKAAHERNSTKTRNVAVAYTSARARH